MGSVDVLEIPTDSAIWDRFFMVAPLAIVGTRTGTATISLRSTRRCRSGANFFCFVYPEPRDLPERPREHGEFVFVPRPDQLVETSLAAHPRRPDGWNPGLEPADAARTRGPGAGGGVLAGSGVRARSDPRRIRRRLLDRRARRSGLGQRELARSPTSTTSSCFTPPLSWPTSRRAGSPRSPATCPSRSRPAFAVAARGADREGAARAATRARGDMAGPARAARLVESPSLVPDSQGRPSPCSWRSSSEVGLDVTRVPAAASADHLHARPREGRRRAPTSSSSATSTPSGRWGP